MKKARRRKEKGKCEKRGVRERKQSRGRREKSILCKPAVQPLALRYSLHLHKKGGGRGGEGSGGVIAGERPRLEVWRRAERSEPCGHIRATRSLITSLHEPDPLYSPPPPS